MSDKRRLLRRWNGRAYVYVVALEGAKTNDVATRVVSFVYIGSGGGYKCEYRIDEEVPILKPRGVWGSRLFGLKNRLIFLMPRSADDEDRDQMRRSHPTRRIPSGLGRSPAGSE